MTYKLLYFPNLKRRMNYTFCKHFKGYRQEIRVDCLGRCVYCDVHENELGGEENMTLDHFRPRDKFTHLMHTPTNLLWACRKCNELKANLWPAIGTPHTVVNGEGFIDPFVENLGDYFDIQPDGQFVPLKSPAFYMIKILKLNRTGAKKAREKRNKAYEVRKNTQEYYEISMHQIENMLKNKMLPENFRQDLLHHQERLKLQYESLLENAMPDFNLY